MHKTYKTLKLKKNKYNESSKCTFYIYRFKPNLFHFQTTYTNINARKCSESLYE